MRITLHHLPLTRRTNFVTAPLSPGNEELLVRRKAVESWLRVLLFRFLKRQIGDFGARKISNAFAEHQLAIVVNVRFDEIVVELMGYTGSATLEPFQVISSPPVVEPALRVELRALIVETVADFVSHDDANRSIIHGIHCIHVERR